MMIILGEIIMATGWLADCLITPSDIDYAWEKHGGGHELFAVPFIPSVFEQALHVYMPEAKKARCRVQ